MGGPKITWIPTVENMLEDALLMIALYVWEDEELCDMAWRHFKNKRRNWVELYEDIDGAPASNVSEKPLSRNRGKNHHFRFRTFIDFASAKRSQEVQNGYGGLYIQVLSLPFRLGRQDHRKRFVGRTCTGKTGSSMIG